MKNRGIDAALKYHEGTKHSYLSVRSNRHVLDWANQPLPFKIYPDIERIALPAEITLGFVDTEVNRLLDLDTRREVSLCIVPVGRTSESSSPAPREIPPLGFATIPVSQRDVEYPAMLEMHEASSLASAEEVAQWRERGRQALSSSSAPADDRVRLQPLREGEQPSDTIDEVILRRGSTRTFDASASITLAQLSTILDRATRGLP